MAEKRGQIGRQTAGKQDPEAAENKGQVESMDNNVTTTENRDGSEGRPDGKADGEKGRTSL